MGSTAYIALITTISGVTNVLFNILCFSLYLLGVDSAIGWHCAGFWSIIFALITIDCMKVIVYYI